MAFWQKASRPIDRSVEELEKQIAALQREIHQEQLTRFFKGMLAPATESVTTSYRAQPDLFDIGAEPLKELAAEPIAFARKPEPDLFAAAPSATPNAAAPDAPHSAEKLAHYLSAGSIRTYRPLKRAQREARNKFFMWMGLSLGAFALIYFVVR
jgi:hypothetical protein